MADIVNRYNKIPNNIGRTATISLDEYDGYQSLERELNDYKDNNMIVIHYYFRGMIEDIDVKTKDETIKLLSDKIIEVSKESIEWYNKYIEESKLNKEKSDTINKLSEVSQTLTFQLDAEKNKNKLQQHIPWYKKIFNLK